MPVVRGIRVLNAISTGNTTPACLDTLLSDAGRLADVTQVLSSPSYSCMLAQSNTAAHTLVRSNNAMTALFGNPIGSCIFYQTTNSRDDMLGSSCYYNYMMSFSTPEATCAFTNFGNSPAMINCAFSSCTAFLTTAVSANSEIDKMLTCNSCVSACFRGITCSIKEAVGTPGRAAHWLGNATAFSCLQASGLGVAFANAVFLETLNRDIACVICTPALNCCAFGLASPANTYTRSVCATNEIVNKGACALGETSCNFVCWYTSCFGVTCMANFLASGNTYFMDQFNALNSFRQRSCLFFLRTNKDCYCSCVINAAGTAAACNAHLIAKSEFLGRGGEYVANNANFPMIYYPHSNGQRICPMTITNGCQLSNTEIEYLGRFIKCNYNVITHADCRFTLMSPGFWNQSSAIACFRSCYCCSLSRTTANTSGLTLNCGLYYTTDNAATFNRLCVPLPACIFQQLCGNCCCQFTVRYALSTFACCNYVYTGWIISDCGTGFGACCTPAYFKTGHSRVCIHSANSQPNYDTWTHYPNVPLPFYTIAFCDDYFAGVSPMRTDGYQSELGIQNQSCCQCPGQYAMMFSFGKVGDCVRVSCDHFVRNAPAGLICFDVCGCSFACCSLPAITHCVFGTCFEDYFQGHGGSLVPTCYCMSPYAACIDTGGIKRLMQAPAGTSHTLIYKNPNNQADSKAFLVGWRSFAMLYGGTIGGACSTCAVLSGITPFLYNCCNARSEGLPNGCGYFRNTPGVNVWCYGSQANNTMQGTELDCTNALAIGGGAASWTNFTFANAKIIGCRLVLAGAMPPVMTLCQCYSCADNCSGATAHGQSREHLNGGYGCQNTTGQSGHTTVINTDGVVGTIVCCFDSMYHQTPHNTSKDTAICTQVHYCNYCSGRCFCCMQGICSCIDFGIPIWFSSPATSDQAGLKTINLYGSSNSIYSVPSFPNMPPICACCGTSHQTGTVTNCYSSPAPSGTTVMKSDKSGYCTIDIGDATQCQFGTLCSPVRPCASGFLRECNPGVSNAIAVSINAHYFSTSSWNPCAFVGVYTPPNCSQDMSTFDSTYNFCYIITPHRDICLGASVGPYCWQQPCECFGPNCCLSVPCSPCCPNCNLVLCCICGAYCSTIVNCMPVCDITRTNGFTRQHVCVNCIASNFPCEMSPPRFCNPAITGCPGLGNHHNATAAANSTWQCAMSTYLHIDCGQFSFVEGCCCSNSNTCCFLRPYDRLLRTCNQAGPNCMWFDFMSSGVAHWSLNDGHCILPCKTHWNKQYLMDNALCCSCSSLLVRGLNYMATDDSKRAGYQLYSTNDRCCLLSVDSVSYPILYATQTRGSGGPLNTQNSIHIAYFDLVPYRCTVTGGSGFFANGNACPGPSGLTCCLMFVKQDIFYNL